MVNLYRAAIGAWLSLFLLVAGSSLPSQARDYAFGPITVAQPAVRIPPPGATTAAVYLRIGNVSNAAIRLLGGSSPAAQRVEIHTMSMDGGVMRMRPLPYLDVPANGSVSFAPGGLHLMLVGLRGPITAGHAVPLTLNFSTGSVTLNVEVGGMASGGMHDGM